MKFVIVLLSFISILYSQDTAGYKFDVILDSVINKAAVEVNKEHSKEIKALTTVDSSTECDKEAVAAEIAQYQQQLHALQQATYELTCNELANYKRCAFNNSMAIVSIGAGIVASIVAISNVWHEKAYKTPTLEITLGVGVVAAGLSRFIRQW
jgi:K+/H+ antiporter YhaU regulatory subunit KhtT